MVLQSDSSNLAMLVDSSGKIAKIGTIDELSYLAAMDGCACQLSVDGGVLLPGFVDAHTHPVFAGDRVHEFSMKLAGATYMEIQKAGGGILYTVEKCRETSEDQLLSSFESVAMEMIQCGTTTIEAKSGYGLDTETELKLLRIIDMGAQFLPLEISGTFLGAHAIPQGSTEQEQAEKIINEMIPLIEKEKSDFHLESIENIDVFCEKGVFEVESSRKILEAGKKIGLKANFHAEELKQLGSAEMGANLKARAMSHLEAISSNGIDAMAESGTVAILLPTTALTLRLRHPPARDMISKGVIVALGSDFNPNAYCLSMPIVMYLACTQMRLSMAEALVASTINAAYSINRGKTHGALSCGRFADIVVLGRHFISFLS
ncbi:unnamed protein product [Dracunculus medinensis]|uniref:Probable imidazolonepropionase n=1 Tax=Dracunculus medinensis TaxID=318479 RepID=A0A0N4U1S7_DRAME|nr:unnamed protein product [Dracunculus medinensis]